MRSIIQGQNASLIMDSLEVRILLGLVFFCTKNVVKEFQFGQHRDRDVKSRSTVLQFVSQICQATLFFSARWFHGFGKSKRHKFQVFCEDKKILKVE